MALIETLRDDFSTQDTAKWTFIDATVSGGVLPVPAPLAALDYNGAESVNTYDLTGSSAMIEVTSILTGGTSVETYLTLKNADSSNELVIMTQGQGSINFRHKVAGVENNFFITYDAVAHRVWRIRESAGTIYWETSPNTSPNGWTVQKTLATPFDITALRVGLVAGYWDSAQTASGTAQYDNLNFDKSLESLQDDFTTKTALWNWGTDTRVTHDAINGRTRIDIATGYPGLYSTASDLSLANSYVEWEVSKWTGTGTGAEAVFSLTDKDAANATRVHIILATNGRAYCRIDTDGVRTYNQNFLYDLANRPFFRIENNGADVWFSDSADRVTWTERLRAVGGYLAWMDHVQFFFQHGDWSGGATGSLWVDGINTASGQPFVFVDLFDRPDTTSNLGDAWTSGQGTWGIISGEAYPSTGAASDHTTTPATNDGYIEFDTGSVGPGSGISYRYLFRYTDATDHAFLDVNDTGRIWLYRMTPTGTVFEAGTAATTDVWAAHDIIRIEYQGLSVRVFLNGRNVMDTTVDLVNPGTRAGLWMPMGPPNGINSRFGAFSVNTLLPLRASFDTFTDRFNDASKWTPDGLAEISGGTLNLPAQTAANDYDEARSYREFDLTGAAVYFELIERLSGINSDDVVIYLDAAGDNHLAIWASRTQIGFRTKIDGQFSNIIIPYDPAVHRWWRIREDTGTIYWDTSHDGITWTNRRSVPTPFDVTALSLSLLSGYWDAAENGLATGAVRIDNVNVTVVNAGAVQYYNGSAWESRPVKWWNGSSWITKPANYREGGRWLVTVMVLYPNTTAYPGSTTYPVVDPNRIALTESWTGADGSSWPAQWIDTKTDTGASSTIVSNMGRLATPNGSYQGIYRRLDGSHTNDSTFSFDYISRGLDAEWGYFQARARNDVTLDNGYIFEIAESGGNRVISLIRRDAGVQTVLISKVTVGIHTSGQLFHAKFEVVGSSLRGKTWASGTAEPSWQIDFADTTYNSGHFAFAHIAKSVVDANSATDIDNFVIEGR